MANDYQVMKADIKCQYEYALELQEGRVFKSTHAFPSIRRSDSSLWGKIRPWVDSSMSLLLELGNLVSQQFETLMLVIHHSQSDKNFAYPLLVAAPEEKAPEEDAKNVSDKQDGLFDVARQRLGVGLVVIIPGKGLISPLCIAAHAALVQQLDTQHVGRAVVVSQEDGISKLWCPVTLPLDLDNGVSVMKT
jgi:hypothetical protein